MVIEVPLTRGYVALIDDDDYDRVVGAGKWSARPKDRIVYAQRYARSAAGRTSTIQLHTFLTGWPLVDHINHDGLDNRRANLRPATAAQNSRNARRRLDNGTGYRGVSFYRAGNRYVPRIRVDGVSTCLGSFPDPMSAARAYDRAAIELHGDFASINFPREDYR